MTEPNFIPEPGNASESSLIDFSTLEAETTAPIGSFEMPNRNAGKKRRWWESKPRAEKKTERRIPKATPTMPRGGLKPALENFYVGIGLAMLPFDPHCAGIVLDNAEKCAASMDEWAKTNQAVRRVLIQLVNATAFGAVFAAHAPIIMAISMHHIPALREKQEKMAGEMGEMFARMAAQSRKENDEE